MNSRSLLSTRDFAFLANVRVQVLGVLSNISTDRSLLVAVGMGSGSVGVFLFSVISGVLLSVICGYVCVDRFMRFAKLLTIELRFTIWLCSSFWFFSQCVIRACYSRWFEYPIV